jgi:hypothetical protein
MTGSKVSMLCLLTAVLALGAIPMRASDPVGAYTIVDKVVLMPDTTAPTSAQIVGVFSFAVPRAADLNQPWPPGSFGTAGTGDVYGAVQKGYLYYTCPRGQDDTCRNEWADLKALAGKPDIVGFGSRWRMSVRVRPLTEALANPDVYPLNIGLVRMGGYGATGRTNRSQYPDLVAALRAASRGK